VGVPSDINVDLLESDTLGGDSPASARSRIFQEDSEACSEAELLLMKMVRVCFWALTSSIQYGIWIEKLTSLSDRARGVYAHVSNSRQ
jgi:hypothetical protein